MGLIEQIQDLKFTVDQAQMSALEFVTVLVESEPLIDRLSQKMEKLKMDATTFLATVKLIDDATTATGVSVTAMGDSVLAVSDRLKTMAKIISDNVTGNVAVDAAVSQLAKDAALLAKTADVAAATAAALKLIAADPLNPLPPPPDPQAP